MKTIILSTLALCLFVSAFAAPKRFTLLNSTTNWNNSANWSPAGVPSTGDSVSIPQGLQITFASDFTFQSMYFDIYGTLALASNNMKIVLQNVSTINVHTGGVIDGSLASQQILFSNTIVFKGDQVLVGPQIATSVSNVFSPYIEFTTLPVTFISFSAVRSTGGNKVQWMAAEAQNDRSYEVQRSSNGTSWTTLATMWAVGNGTYTYTFSDNVNGSSTVYYRIKQQDTDGTVTYSVVRILKSETSAPEITAALNRISVVFAQALKGNAVVEIIALNGTIVAKQMVAEGTETVQLSTAGLRGIYIVHVSNAQNLNKAKQVLL